MLRVFLAGAKVGISFLLLWYATRDVEIDSVYQTLARIEPRAMAAALLLITTQNLIAGARWWFVIRRLGTFIPLSSALRFFFVSLFLGQTLPSAVGEAARIWLVHRYTASVTRALNSVVLDRLLTAAGLVVLILCSIPFLPSIGVDGPTVLWIALICLGVVLAMCAVALIPWLAGLPLIGRVARLFAETRQFASSLQNLVVPVSLSVVAFLIMVTLVYALAVATATEVCWWQLVLLCPPVFLLASVPISVAGWGVRETGMVLALSYVGVPAPAALALSVVVGLTILAGSLPGGFLIATTRLAWRRVGHADEKSA